MNHGQTVFAQLVGHLSHDEFRRCVNRYQGNRGVRSFSCWDQFLAMAFAQLTFRESLRDLEDSLGALQPKLYHLGFHAAVKRSTLADANETRDWRIFAAFAHSLISIARPLYADAPRCAMRIFREGWRTSDPDSSACDNDLQLIN